MSFDDRLLHSLVVIESAVDDTVGNRDEYGQPVSTVQSAMKFRGLIQPKTAREVALVSQAGAAITDHTLFMRPREIQGGDHVRFDPDDGRRYEVTGIRDAAGIGHHLEVDLRMVQGTAGEELGS